MVYERPWKTYAEQLEILESRGLKVTDKPAALSYLERIGFYRLSAYWHPFRVFEIQQDPETKKLESVRTDKFVENTQFPDAVELYLFDKKLRLLVMDALERIEVAIRVDVAYLLGQRDAFAYKDLSQFHPTFATRIDRFTKNTAHQQWLQKYAGLLQRSKEDFVKHYRQNHGTDLPIWVALEIWDFGALSQLFSMMKVPDQQVIAKKYGITDFKVFSSWLRSLNYLRNLVAHHSRLWNRNIIDQPKLPAKEQIPWCDGFIGKADLVARPFLLLAIANHLLKVICPETEWNQRVKTHLDEFPQIYSDKQVGITDMGTIEGWESWW